MIETLKFKKMHEDAKAPLRGTENSAGLDLSAVHDEVIMPNQVKLVDLGIAFEIPSNHYLQLYARSSLPLKKGLIVANSVGVIDEDFTDSLKIQLFNITNQPVKISSGERIAQVVLSKVEYPRALETTEIRTTKRSGGSFGSTGS